MSERDYRKDIEESIIISWMDQQLSKTTSGISPGRIKKYYDAHQKDFNQDEAVKLRQITLKPVADNTMDLLMQQANLIVQQARLPDASFADLARKNSQDDFARNGGLFADNNGWIERKKYLPVLEDVIFNLKPGEVSDPVANNGNVYIFKCDDKRAEGIQPLEGESVHTVIEKILADQDQKEEEQKWIQKLEAKAYIRYNLGIPDGT
jgi:parvulin-like peptidyl-prolyl isomerase